MSSGSDSGSIQRDPRVSISGERLGEVLVERTTDSGTEVLKGKLLDLSRGGAKVAVSSCVPFDEVVKLTFKIPQLEMEFSVPGDVSWSRKGDDGRWMVGCCFCHGLPHDSIDRLAEAGFLERRKNARYPIAAKATAKWELSESSVPVVLQDFSVDGFCMLSSKAGRPGQRLRLRVEKPNGGYASISARMRWSIGTEEGHLVGCAFLNGHDAHHLWEITYNLRSNQPLLPRISLPQSPWNVAWFATLVTFIIVYPVIIHIVSRDSARSRALAAAESMPAPTESQEPAGEAPDPPPPAAQAEIEPFRDTPRDRQQLESRMAAWKEQVQHDLTHLARREEQLKQQQQQWKDDLARQQDMLRSQQQELACEQQSLEAERNELLQAKQSWLAERPQPEEEPPRQEVPRVRDLVPADDIPSTETPPAAAATGAVAGEETPESPAVSAPPVPEISPAEAKAADHAAERLRQGRAALLANDVAAAITAFEASLAIDDRQPLAYYMLALAQFQSNQGDEASANVRRAARLENERPIAGWGRVMQRFQGTARLWLENARREARRSQSL